MYKLKKIKKNFKELLFHSSVKSFTFLFVRLNLHKMKKEIVGLIFYFEKVLLPFFYTLSCSMLQNKTRFLTYNMNFTN